MRPLLTLILPRLMKRFSRLTGVLEVGLFCGMAKAAYFGNEDGNITVRYADGRPAQHIAAAEAEKASAVQKTEKQLPKDDETRVAGYSTAEASKASE